jgi:hypothetical protein
MSDPILPEWLRGRFEPLPDVADWDSLAAGLDVEAHFASVVALAEQLLAAPDPWPESDPKPLGLTPEQRDRLR